jgi:DNA-binding PucR family transcriptional regulator
MLVPYLIDNIGRIVEKVSAVEFENSLVLIIAIKRYAYIKKHDIGFLEKYLTERNMHGGLSRPFDEIRGIRKFYRQAVSAMKSGFRLHPSKSLYHYDDYAAYAMMDECFSKRDLLEFCHPVVISLYEKDRKEGTCDLNTLIEYAAFRNMNKAAQALGIHRNTLSYRIAKIVDETRIDLDNVLTVSELLQSKRILEYLNMT